MNDHADEPLMQAGEEEDHSLANEDGLPNPTLEEAHYPGAFVWSLTLSAGISGLLFGYDTGVISATLVSIGSSLSSRPLTTLDKSFITASTSLCALLISPLSSYIADTFGRKRVILLADLLFILGALIQAMSSSVTLMIIGRAIVGLAIGAASFVTPLYIAELAPKEFRGRLVTLNVLLITFGQVVAYVIGWAFTLHETPNNWRWMVGLGAVPAVFQLCLIIIMPESPRFLVKIGEVEGAQQVLERVFRQVDGNSKVAGSIMRAIQKEVREEEEAKRGRMRGRPTKEQQRRCAPELSDSWVELFGVPRHRRALAIACLLQGLQQACGFNALMYFSGTLFSLIGFSSPMLTSLSVAVTNAIFTVISLLLIDTIGRRRILLASVPIMSFALLCCAAGFIYIILPTDTNSSNPASTPSAYSSIPWSERSAPLVVLASIILYVSAYAIGIGNIPWQQSELFSLSVRSLGSALATSTNWGANFIVGLTFLPMLEWFSPSWTFVIYAVLCVVGWILVWLFYPETSGMSLEETGMLLSDGWGAGINAPLLRQTRIAARIAAANANNQS